MSAMMKIEQEPRTYLAVRAIGSGIQNLLFSDPRTVEDVEECVSAVRAEAPDSGGRHGVGLRRDVGLVLEAGTPAFVEALDQAVIALMIEKDPAVENLEDLLSVDGVDMVQFGPAGLRDEHRPGRTAGPSEGQGGRGTRDLDRAPDGDLAPRAELRDREGAERYLDMGVKHFCVGTDVRIPVRLVFKGHRRRDAGPPGA